MVKVAAFVEKSVTAQIQSVEWLALSGLCHAHAAGIDSDIGLDWKFITRSSADAARQAAQSEMQRVDRGAATLSLALALGRPHLMPQAAVTVEGFKPEIDGEGWLVKSVEHALGDGGFTTQIELERQGQGDIPTDDLLD